MDLLLKRDLLLLESKDDSAKTEGKLEKDDKYYIYSSHKEGAPGGDNIQVLTPGSNVDNFVSKLTNMVIILQGPPTKDNVLIKFDEKDIWATWMASLDEKGSLSLTFDNDTSKAITSFRYQFSDPWDITFSSDAGTLLYTYGTPAGITDNERIPVPGLMTDGLLLYMGLDTKITTKKIESTIEELYDFAGLEVAPPSFLKDWKIFLDPSDTNNSGKRNAMWFDPVNFMQTVVRLRFSLDTNAKDNFQKLFDKVLPGLTFTAVDAVATRSAVLADTEKGAAPVENGRFYFLVESTVKPEGHDAVKLSASVKCYEAGYSLTLRFDTPGAISGLLAWVAGLVGAEDAMKFIEGLLGNEVFSGVNLRQIKIAIEKDEEAKKTSVSSFRVDFEISTSFGKKSESAQSVVFLISYHWSKSIGGSGSISGEFWNYFDLSLTRDLSSTYEEIDDLRPLASFPATSLDLISLIPGETIQNLPAQIHPVMTQGYISVSTEQCVLGGVVKPSDWEASGDYDVPQLRLGQISLNAAFSWGQNKNFRFGLGVITELKPSEHSKHQETAILGGKIEYNSKDGTWLLDATLEGLYASTLYEFFDPSSVNHVVPLIDSLAIASMELKYQYTSAKSGQDAGKSVGSYFKFEGLLLIAALDLKLNFEYKDKAWTFTAVLETQDEEATIGEILESILGDDQLELPDFLADTKLEGKSGHVFSLDIRKGAKPVPGKGNSGNGSFQLVADLNIGPLEFTFAQLHAENWPAKAPSKRMIKAALTELPHVNIPLIGDITQPFDEMYFMWIQDGSKQDKVPGFTRKDIENLRLALGDGSLTCKDKYSDPKPEDLLMTAGCHFGIVLKDTGGKKTCILDYDFKGKDKKKPPAKTGQSSALAKTESPGKEKEPDTGGSDDSSSGGKNSSAPMKKKLGPLSISNIGLKYANKTLHIQLDATFELGPIGFTLIGFSIDAQITSLDLSGIKPGFGIKGLAVAFEKAPLTIAGIIRHDDEKGVNYYAGGLIVGWVPYQLQAAGFYGECTPEGTTGDESKFISIFVFARLDGPLVTLEFAEISGVTGGFGYKSDIRLPSAADITNFPFIASTSKIGDAANSALDTLARLTSPNEDGWFRPMDDTYWAAAGMKIDAFQMISLDAVAVVEFGQSIKMSILAVALVDIPTSASPVKYAHVELGIAITVDFDLGVLKAEAQLSPNSYILDPNCHLTGGFALYYWFDAPHCSRDLVGSFVFTLGGFHQAFEIPVGWPNPPRLGISWSLGSNLSIKGEAYFAITPKVCMGGGRLRASFSAGPIKAWFDAFANFLINYKPFHFYSEAGICVGASFNLDVLFVHIHISVEVGADLYLWGPPMAGRVHVDIKVAKFNINFGSDESGKEKVDLAGFYDLILQESSKTEEDSGKVGGKAIAAAASTPDPLKQGHTFLAQSGLMKKDDNARKKKNADWIVRGGTFSFQLGCKIAISNAKQQAEDKTELNSVTYTENTIYAKPLRLDSDALESTATVTITQLETDDDKAVWGMEKFIKSVPTGLWGKYNGSDDPSSGNNNNVGSLLKSKDSAVPLMMGVTFRAPPPVMSKDKLPVFDIEDATLRNIQAGRKFPTEIAASTDWNAEEVDNPKGQWEKVHNTWKKPEWDADGSGGDEGVQTRFVKKWAEVFNWDGALSGLAKLPKLLDKRFDGIYMAAPLMTK